MARLMRSLLHVYQSYYLLTSNRRFFFPSPVFIFRILFQKESFMGVISISIPDDLQEVFDKFSEEHHFASRSDAFRAAIQALINQTEEVSKIQGEHAFLSAYVFRDKPDTWERFENQMDVFRNHIKNIHSYKFGSQRICTLFSIGNARDIEKMHGALSTTKDVNEALLNVIL